MPIGLFNVGATLTAAIMNAIRDLVNAIGSNSITPTSVAGTGVSLSGAKVIASAATSISVNGCFTTAYDAYELEWDLTTSGAGLLVGTLRLAGTDAVTAYDNQRTSSVSAATTTSQSLNAANITIETAGAGVTGRHGGIMRIYGPAVAAVTTGHVRSGASQATMTTTALLCTVFFNHRTTTAYDGFTITPTTGNVTGWVRVRGIGTP